MAVSNRITYNPTSLGGSHLAAAARYTILAKQEIDRAVSLAASVSAFGATTANLEGTPEFNVAAGGGAVFYSAITTLRVNLNAITDAQLANLDQG